MKSEIKGISKEETIKKYKLYKDGIKVVYLKGGYDFHSIDKKEIIDQKMLEQAKKIY